MAEWTFLTNHARVLSIIASNTRITAVEISQLIDIQERAIRKIIADLDEDGYIDKKKEGRRLRYRINPNLSLRTDNHQHVAIGDFLGALGWNGTKRRVAKK